MIRGRFFWKLFFGHAALITAVLVAYVWTLRVQLDRFQEQLIEDHLATEASILAGMAEDRFRPDRRAELGRLGKSVAPETLRGMRITFVLVDGTVLGDTAADPSAMESHADRPEIRDAVRTGQGRSTRWSRTLLQEMTYVAARVGPDVAPVGVVRVALPTQGVRALVGPTKRLLLVTGVATAIAGVMLAMGLALLWSRRISRITAAARSLSRGEPAAQLDISGKDEVAVLARLLNRMRDHLTSNMETIDRQRRTLDSLIRQLREGVVAVDASGRVVLANAEAERLLKIAPPGGERSLVGLAVEQCIQQRSLLELLLPVESPAQDHSPAREDSTGSANGAPSAEVVERKLEVETASGTVSLLARAFDIVLPEFDAVFADGDRGERHLGRAGRLLVLTDVTELTQIMQMKADFAANASHELRTPLSALRGAIETLQSIDWQRDGETVARWLSVLERHSRRMEAMMRDLLDLSRLELSTAPFESVSIMIRPMLDELYDSFAEQIEVRNQRWTTNIARRCERVSADPELLRIVLRNLVDNAIRFTPSGGMISVFVEREDASSDRLAISVADTGCGIPREEHDRVFERFYQVERARSGSERGTGLGLSIVRHAVAAMNGGVMLKSEVGAGTRVTVFLPAAAIPAALP